MFYVIFYLAYQRARMRIPTLEHIYQTMEKQQQILSKEKEKIERIKTKIGVRNSTPTKIKYSHSNVANLYERYIFLLLDHSKLICLFFRLFSEK